MTLEQLEALAFAIRKKGPRWAALLPHLRETWARMKRGEEPGENVLRIAGALQRGSMEIGTKCPKCPPPAEGTWAGSRTVLSLPDRWVSACAKCGTEWVTITR